MIKNYLTVAIRNIARNKTFSAINILGLAIGMACCILILLYVQDDLSYDQHHEHAHRIYRVAAEGKIAGTMRQYAVTPLPMGPALVTDYPEVIETMRFSRADPKTLVGDQHGHFFYENGVVFTDPNFFQVFNFPLSKGNPRTAFSEPYSVVITKAIAQKYFGEQSPMGQILSFNDKAFKVTGVLKDKAHNTHFQFNLLASPMSRDHQSNWLRHDFYTYLLLQKRDSAQGLEAKLTDFIEAHAGELLKPGGFARYFLQPLTDIHLRSHLEGEMSENSDIRYVYLFLIIIFEYTGTTISHQSVSLPCCFCRSLTSRI